MKKLITIYVFATMASVAYALPSDDFNDNSRNTSLWNLFEPDPCNVWLDETNQRLELRGINPVAGPGDSAFYVANGWGFLTTDSFSFRVDFHNSFTSPQDSNSWVAVILALGYEQDVSNFNCPAPCPCMHRVSIEAAWDAVSMSPMDFLYNRSIIDCNLGHLKIPRESNDGTLYISYDAGADELYLSHTGYGKTAADVNVNVLDSIWQGSVVSPFLGGTVDYTSIMVNSGDAYLDNFVVDSGTVIIMGDLNGDGSVNFEDLMIFCEHWLNTGCVQPYGCGGADLNNDTNVDFRDFSILANNWLKSLIDLND